MKKFSRKKEIDAYTFSSQQVFDELLSLKKDIRSKSDQEKFERSKFTDFKIKQEIKIKDEAVKLYEETVVVQFYDFFLRFEKWMRFETFFSAFSLINFLFNYIYILKLK